MKVFSRQLRYADTLVNAYARLTAEALSNGRFALAKSLAHSYARARQFRNSDKWYEWKCSSYEIFSKKFSELYKEGV